MACEETVMKYTVRNVRIIDYQLERRSLVTSHNTKQQGVSFLPIPHTMAVAADTAALFDMAGVTQHNTKSKKTGKISYISPQGYPSCLISANHPPEVHPR